MFEQSSTHPSPWLIRLHISDFLRKGRKDLRFCESSSVILASGCRLFRHDFEKQQAIGRQIVREKMGEFPCVPVKPMLLLPPCCGGLCYYGFALAKKEMSFQHLLLAVLFWPLTTLFLSSELSAAEAESLCSSCRNLNSFAFAFRHRADEELLLLLVLWT